METFYKSIFECDEDIIVHQVNCQGAFGSGVAGQVANLYPHVKKEYITYVNDAKKEYNFDTSKLLGNVLIVEISPKGKYIANVFGQEFYGYGGEVYTDRKALIEGIKDVKEFAKENGLSIAIPSKIGCALGGENWNVISKKIKNIFKDGEVKANFYSYTPKR